MSRQGGSWAAAAAALKALERLSPWLRVAAAAGATITVVALTLAVLGWMKPVIEKQAATAQPERSITFSYSATVPKSPAYDGTTVTSPDPVFRRIVDHVDLHARYHGPAGTFRLTATLTNGTGWHSAMTLVRDKAIAGPDYDVTVPLDLSSLTARADDASRAIGAPATGSVSIALNAAVSLSGPALSAPLNLTITPAQMSLGAGSMLRTTTAGGDPSGVLVPRRIRILGLSLMTASEARSDAVLCLLGVAGIAVALFLVARRRTPLRTRADIERRYAPFLVHVEPMASPPGKPVVNVDNFPALVRLAERYGQMILTWRRPDADCFVVRDEGITYRYRILLDEPATQNVELINRPTGAGSHRRRATSEAS